MTIEEAKTTYGGRDGYVPDVLLNIRSIVVITRRIIVLDMMMSTKRLLSI